MSETFTCPVCITSRAKNEEFGKRLGCEHWICWHCFAEMMRSKKSTSVTCPLCREIDRPSGIVEDASESEADDNEFPEFPESDTAIQQNNQRLVFESATFTNCRVYFSPGSK